MLSVINELDYVKIGDRLLYNAIFRMYKEAGLIEITYLKRMYEVGVSVVTSRRGKGKIENKELHQNHGRIRAGQKVRELIMSNDLMYHWSITYENADEGSQMDQVKKDFKKFIMRLKWHMKLEKLPYVAVLEIQEERYRKYNEKVWHIHLVLDKRYNHKEMERIWGKGFVYVQKHAGNLQLVAGYLTKYLKKDMEKYDVPEKKRYLCSQGLKRVDKKKVGVDEEVKKLIDRIASVKMEYEKISWYQLEVDKLNEVAEALGHEKIIIE